MSTFLSKVTYFATFCIVVVVALVLGIYLLESGVVTFDLPSNKTILVVGNSFTECSINDNILTNVSNMSQSGEGYFYSYLKVKQILKRNPQIDTLVIGYSYECLSKSREAWFGSTNFIRSKVPSYFFLFDSDDLWSMFTTNPYDLLYSVPRSIHIGLVATIKYALSNQSMSSWGGYLFIEEEELEQARALYIADKKNDPVEFSPIQKKYLVKIFNLASSYDVKVILLATPIHPILESGLAKYKDHYYSFAEQQLHGAVLINHSSFDIPESGYYDLEHINHKGATLYSEYIKQYGFASLLHDKE